MQRERLEGWMVKQIENADLAKETVIQLPSRASAAAALPRYAQLDSARPPSPRRAPVSPRRPLTSSSASLSVQVESHRKTTGGDAVTPSAMMPRSPRQREFGSDHTIRISTEHERNATSLEKQWRARFLDPSRQRLGEQSGCVDRTKVLRWNPLESDSGDTVGHDGRGGDESASPLFLWGLPREHIVEYIRQSVLPSSWSMCVQEHRAIPVGLVIGSHAHAGVLSTMLMQGDKVLLGGVGSSGWRRERCRPSRVAVRFLMSALHSLWRVESILTSFVQSQSVGVAAPAASPAEDRERIDDYYCAWKPYRESTGERDESEGLTGCGITGQTTTHKPVPGWHVFSTRDPSTTHITTLG